MDAAVESKELLVNILVAMGVSFLVARPQIMQRSTPLRIVIDLALLAFVFFVALLRTRQKLRR